MSTSSPMQSPDTTPESAPAPTRNKGGRPKGSKTRPKWLVKQMKRPRGRPKGSKNKPKNLEAFLTQAMNIQVPPKPKKPPPKGGVSPALKARNERPIEIRREEGRRNNALRKRKVSFNPGNPRGWSNKAYLPLKEEAKADARRIFKIMDSQGLVPEDEIAREALLNVLTLMREPGDKKFKHSLARTLLEYTKQKPTAKSEVRIAAEDFLSGLASDEDDDEPA